MDQLTRTLFRSLLQQTVTLHELGSVIAVDAVGATRLRRVADTRPRPITDSDR